MVAIIDYGAGNLMSVKKALDFIGAKSSVTADKDEIKNASHVILPGVGSFGDAMAAMERSALTQTVKDAALSGKPFLGICLGLQLLFSESDESPGIKGLSLLSGKISRIPQKDGLKVPHMGWNSVSQRQSGGIFKNIPDNSYFYFVHSYYLNSADETAVAGVTEYGVEIQCAVQRSNLCAVQFHPEKSGEVGLELLKNFLRLEER